MKLYYDYRSFSTYLFYFIGIVFASSCTIYQYVPDNDGIYSSETNRNKVIVANSKEHTEYENNYFTQELERIDRINGTDIFTDIETYNSVNDNEPVSNSTDYIGDYNPNSAWGYKDSDNVVVNINLNNNGFGWNDFWNNYDPYFGYGYFNAWPRRYWGFGWRNRWGYPNYWGGYGYYNNPFYNPFGPYYYGMTGYRFLSWRNYYRNRYSYNQSRNYNYGRRSNNNNYYNRNSSNSTTRRANAFVSNNNSSSRSRRSSAERDKNIQRLTNIKRRNSNTSSTRTNTGNNYSNRTSTRRASPSRRGSTLKRQSTRSSSPSRRTTISRGTSMPRTSSSSRRSSPRSR